MVSTGKEDTEDKQPHHQMGGDIFTTSSLPKSAQQAPILLSSTAESWLCKQRSHVLSPGGFLPLDMDQPTLSALCGAGPPDVGMEGEQ